MFTSFCRVLRVRLPYRRSRVKWICATTAPWALATGLLISFTGVHQQYPAGDVYVKFMDVNGNEFPPYTFTQMQHIPLTSIDNDVDYFRVFATFDVTFATTTIVRTKAYALATDELVPDIQLWGFF